MVAATVVARLSNIAWYNRTPLCVATIANQRTAAFSHEPYIHSALHGGRIAVRNLVRILLCNV